MKKRRSHPSRHSVPQIKSRAHSNSTAAIKSSLFHCHRRDPFSNETISLFICAHVHPPPACVELPFLRPRLVVVGARLHKYLHAPGTEVSNRRTGEWGACWRTGEVSRRGEEKAEGNVGGSESSDKFRGCQTRVRD